MKKRRISSLNEQYAEEDELLLFRTPSFCWMVQMVLIELLCS